MATSEHKGQDAQGHRVEKDGAPPESRDQKPAQRWSQRGADRGQTTGDPLLVRAGRSLVPTPRAIDLREQVSQLVQDGEAVLRPAGKVSDRS